MEQAQAAARPEDLLDHFERILNDDPLIDEVGFLHPTQFHSQPLDGNSTSHQACFWCGRPQARHLLRDPTRPLPHRGHAHSNARAMFHGAAPPSAAAAAAGLMRHIKALLLLCPDLLTAWNSRKMVLSVNYDFAKVEHELRLGALILSYLPKNESTWSHRRWVIKKVAEHHHDMEEFIEKESLLVKEIAEKSKMNYRAWRHRCWLVPYMRRKQVLAELKNLTRWNELHVADNCCFYYRRSLLLALLDSRGVENREDSLNWQSEDHLLWKEELRWTEMLIRRHQGRESLWIHRRFLSQWWVQYLLSHEETCPSGESLMDPFLAQEIHLLSDCLSAPGDEFGEECVQSELAVLYTSWISKRYAVVKQKVEESMQSVGTGEPEGGVSKGLPREEQAVDAFASMLIL